MPRIVRTARGELVDFDAIVIKQQLAQAPMNIEVKRRKEFLDSKEGRARGQKKVAPVSAAVAAETPVTEVAPIVAPETAPTALIDEKPKAKK